MQGIEPRSPGRVNCQSVDLYTIQTLRLEGVDFNKVYYIYNKSCNFTNPSLPQIEISDIGHKGLPIIIGPYSHQDLLDNLYQNSFLEWP